MGYFEGLANANFKKDKAGNTVFFPWGALGRGKILPNEQMETKIRGFVGRYYKISLPTIICVSVIVGWAWSFLLIPIFGAWFHFGSKSLTSGCPDSEEKLTLKEGYVNSAASHKKSTLWLLFIASIMFVLGGVFIASTAKSSGEILLGWSSIVFFGACGVAIGFMLKVKHRA
ncbi:MAG: hypothetical protein V4568_12310 [Pseudomonadota bacterium]